MSSIENLVPVNAAPDTKMWGTLDNSTTTPTFEMPRLAIHIPLIFDFAQDGPTDKGMLVSGGYGNRIYGTETFDLASKFATHQTVFAAMFLNKTNPIFFKRIRPSDAPPPANLRLYADVVTAEEDEYQRDTETGQIKFDTDGVTPLTTGNKIQVTHVKFLQEYVTPENPNDEHNTNIGMGKRLPGTYDVNGTQSEKIPLFDLEAPFFGSVGNLRGIRIWASASRGNRQFNSGLLPQGVYPFNVSFVQKANELATGRQIFSNNGEISVEMCFKPGFVDKNTYVAKYMGDELLDQYRNIHPGPTEPYNYGPFGTLHMYQDNIDSLLRQLYTQERQHDYVGSDVKAGGDDDIYLINLFGLLNSNGNPYQSIRFSTSTQGGVRISENTALYATGGGDGTMSLQQLDDHVYEELLQMTDPNSPWQDWVSNSFTAFWDSGFGLKVKNEMGRVIGLRKDTTVYVATHADNQRQLAPVEESSLGSALRTKLASYPDSEFYGTPAFRGVVHMYSGHLHKTAYPGWRRPVPALFSLANKIAALAGSSNGKFRPENYFDRPPKNLVNELVDMNVTWRPIQVRNRDWAAGLLYIEKYTDRQFFYSAQHTIYPDDTSVLTSIITAIVVAHVQRVSKRAHLEHTGRMATRLELKQAVENFMRKELEGAFGEQFVFVPVVTIEGLDEQNGYSWTLKTTIGAKNTRTVQHVHVETQRYEEVEQVPGAFVA